jgi:4-hydroxybenzoate polyprenyltransferase/phosphoserine phosphatase
MIGMLSRARTSELEVVKPREMEPIPLILDLDNTLLQTDLLWESALCFIRRAPWRVCILLIWLLQGRAFLKARLAKAIRLDVTLLPANEKLVAFAIEESRRGRPVHLVTAANEIFAHQIAKRFSFIDRVLASDETRNLKGEYKALRLAGEFSSGFIYAGDSEADLPVWQIATEIVVTGASPAVLRKARRIREPLAVIPQADRWHALRKSLRPHQWVKNSLVFVPLMLGGAFDPHAIVSTLLVFAALSLAASGTYIVNDLLDLDDDRRHWTKRNRPLASGALPIPLGIGLGLATLLLGFGLAALAGVATLAWLAAYVAVTLTYSLKLKRIAIIDVLTLAGLFTSRLAIGAAAAHIIASPWLLTFAMFLFLSLSLAKRYTEISRAALKGHNALGRGYVAQDAPMVLALGVGSLVASILVFVLYLTQEAFVAAHLASPKFLWLFPPALFLLAARIWLIAGRGELDDDPVSFAVKDRTSLAILGALSLIVGAAWLGMSVLTFGFWESASCSIPPERPALLEIQKDEASFKRKIAYIFAHDASGLRS